MYFSAKNTTCLKYESDPFLLIFLISRLLVIACLFLTWSVTASAQHLEEKHNFSDEFFQEETLTGNWNGLRTRLADQGWEMETEYNGHLFHNPLGGIRRQTDYAGFLDIELNANLERIIGWPNARVLVDLIQLHGTEPSKNLGTVQTVSNQEGPSQFKIFLGWIEQTFWEKRASLRVGIYSLDTEFDFKDSANLFINGVFGTGLDLSETGVTGPAIFPNPALGARIYLKPVESWYLQAAVLDGIPGDPNDATGTHIHLGGGDGYQVVAEGGYAETAKGGRQAKAAVGSLIYTTDLPDLTDVDLKGNPITRSGTFSLYGFADWPVTFETSDPAQGLNLFFRMGMADPDVAHFKFTLTGGAVYTGIFPGRIRDKLGFGFSGAWNGDKYKTSQGGNIENNEWVIEANYKMFLTPGLEVQPNLQYFINPGSNPSLGNAFYLGMAFSLSF